VARHRQRVDHDCQSIGNFNDAGHWYEGTGQFFAGVRKGFRYIPEGSVSMVDVRDVAMLRLAKATWSKSVHRQRWRNQFTTFNAITEFECS